MSDKFVIYYQKEPSTEEGCPKPTCSKQEFYSISENWKVENAKYPSKLQNTESAENLMVKCSWMKLMIEV